MLRHNHVDCCWGVIGAAAQSFQLLEEGDWCYGTDLSDSVEGGVFGAAAQACFDQMMACCL